MLFTKFKVQNRYTLNTPQLADFIHNVLAKQVIETKDVAALDKIYNNILAVEKLGIPQLSGMYLGLKLLTQVKIAPKKDDLYKLTQVNFSAPFDKPGRYRLLIYDQLKSKNIADSVRFSYLDYTIEILEKQLNRIDKPTANAPLLLPYDAEQKPQIRKYLADAYYRKSIISAKNELSFLNLATVYMPDEQDKRKDGGYLTMEYHFMPYVDYNKLYEQKLPPSARSTEGYLKKYIDLVIIQPERYSQLKELYFKSYPNGDFKGFFSAALKEKLPKTPAFTLYETSNKKVNSIDYSGKFTFIDFWGTWCKACVVEIDKVDELYKSNTAPNLTVTTIACFDKKEYIEKFMTKNQFKYPVMLSDNKVEKSFDVTSYPTKLLLLPNGTHIIIPFRDDYKELLNNYMTWDL